MEFLEKDLETIIWEASDNDLEDAGLDFYGKRFRQLRIGNYGIADLVTVKRESIYSESEYIKNGKHKIIDSYLVITVYELKKDKIGVGAFLQAIGYVKGIQSYLNKRNFENFILRIKLVGSDIDNSGNFCFLTDLINNTSKPCDEPMYSNGYIEDVSFYTYHITLKGLKFKCHFGYTLTNEGF